MSINWSVMTQNPSDGSWFAVGMKQKSIFKWPCILIVQTNKKVEKQQQSSLVVNYVERKMRGNKAMFPWWQLTHAQMDVKLLSVVELFQERNVVLHFLERPFAEQQDSSRAKIRQNSKRRWRESCYENKIRTHYLSMKEKFLLWSILKESGNDLSLLDEVWFTFSYLYYFPYTLFESNYCKLCALFFLFFFLPIYASKRLAPSGMTLTFSICVFYTFLKF